MSSFCNGTPDALTGVRVHANFSLWNIEALSQERPRSLQTRGAAAFVSLSSLGRIAALPGL